MNIDIKYSDIYDMEMFDAADKNIPSEKNLNDKIKQFKRQNRKFFSDKFHIKILNLISKYSGLDWCKEDIDVYIVNEFPISAISEPLTIKILKDKDRMIISLVHELIHKIFDCDENKKYIENMIDNLSKQFGTKKYDYYDFLHVAVNFITDLVGNDLIGNKNYGKIVKKIKQYDRLKNSYELLDQIVDKYDNSNVIDFLSKYVPEK